MKFKTWLKYHYDIIKIASLACFKYLCLALFKDLNCLRNTLAFSLLLLALCRSPKS